MICERKKILKFSRTNSFHFIKNFLFIFDFGVLSKIVFGGPLLNTNIIIIYKGKCLDKMYLFDKYC